MTSPPFWRRGAVAGLTLIRHELKIRMTRTTLKTLLFFSLLFSLMLSCEKRPEQERRLIGTWQLQRTDGVNTLLSFQDNATFEVNQQIERNLASHEEKPGTATGTWEINKTATQLTLTTRKADPGIGWQPQTAIYSIVTFGTLTLHLMDPTGKNTLWKKLPNNKGGKGKEAATLKIAPLVVNLAPSAVAANESYQWICTELIITLNNFDISSGLHPRVREKAIFFLNSKSYDDLNTLDKLAATGEELKKALNPYLDHRIDHLTFNNTVLTGRIEAVDQFIAKYAAPEENVAKGH
jgi:hypothetical protein